MAITAGMVKELRELTGAGMMDCKKALGETNGDMDAAVEYLKKNGQAKAEKKAARIAAEGLCAVVVEGNTAAVVEVNSETDFVAKNEEFQKFCAGLGQAILENNPADVAALAECKFPGSDLTVSQMQNEKVLTIGENIQIRRFVRLDNTMKNVAYVHGGGKIGVITRMAVEGIDMANAELVTLGRDLGMQAASMRPQWLKRDDVPAETLEAEKHILMQQTINEGKPEAVAQKIVMGRINKFYEENCLLDQAFVKENKISVQKHVDAVAKELGGKIAIEASIRFEKGEGIAKREDDFAAEVAKMTGK